jgi:hypothetical protein
MGTIDDLAHEMETEAEVLRAVSHMTPTAARELLLRLLLKIQRSCDAPPTITWVPGSSPVLEQDLTPTAEDGAGLSVPLVTRANRTQAMRLLLADRGPMTREQLYEELTGVFQLPLAETKRIASPMLSQLKARRQVNESDEGWLSLATVMRVA